jgi:predicted HAD superfamily Cof-like phosphohydrolase
MNKLLSDVVKFHKTYKQPVIDEPAVPPQARQKLRIELIEEETKELKAAFEAGDIVAVADALADLLYVVNGAVVECGLKDYIDDCHNEVQASNMSKLDSNGKPIFREDGKVLKGPNFFEPNLKAIVLDSKYSTFEKLSIGQTFRYQGDLYMKTTTNAGVTQDDERPKHRAYFEFNPTCPVTKVK